MVKPLEAIPQMTLEAEVLNRLREAILDGSFPPGSQLNQVQVAAGFGTSRGPVRVALNNLEKEGLVRNVPHRGTFVTPIDQKMVRDLYDVRAVLEAYGVRLAVLNFQPAEVAYVNQTVEQMRLAARRGETAEVIRLDFLVHKSFIEGSRNQVLYQTWSALQIQVRRVLSLRHHSYPFLVEIADSHLPFIEALDARDPEKAARAMQEHIQDACADLMERWASLHLPSETQTD